MTEINVKNVTVKKKRPQRRPNTSLEEVSQALIKSGGFIAKAADILGTSISAVSLRVQRTPQLQQLVKEIKSKYVDMAEVELYKKVKAGDTTAIIFTLKCLAKDRGFIERQEIQASLRLSHDDWIKKLNEPE